MFSEKFGDRYVRLIQVSWDSTSSASSWAAASWLDPEFGVTIKVMCILYTQTL